MTNFTIKKIRVNSKIVVSVLTFIVFVTIILFVNNYGKIRIDNGTIISTQEKIYSKIDGNICEILIKENDIVNEGDILIKIFPAKYEIKLKQLESSKIQAEKEYRNFKNILKQRKNKLNIAQKDCDRNLSMFDENITTKQDVDRSVNEMQNANLSYLAAKKDKEDAEKKVKKLKAQIAETKNDIENTKIITPRKGKISKIFVQNNNKIYKNQMVVLINSNRLIIAIPKKQNTLTKIKINQQVMIKPKNSSSKINGTIDEILNNKDFKEKTNPVNTDKCIILSVKTEEDFSKLINEFQNIQMTIKLK